MLLTSGEAQTGFPQFVLHLIPERGAAQRPLHAFIHFRFRKAFIQIYSECDVVVNGHRKRCGLLENHSNLRAQKIQVLGAGKDIAAIQKYLPFGVLIGIELVDAVEHTQECGFSAA